MFPENLQSEHHKVVSETLNYKPEQRKLILKHIRTRVEEGYRWKSDFDWLIAIAEEYLNE